MISPAIFAASIVSESRRSEQYVDERRLPLGGACVYWVVETDYQEYNGLLLFALGFIGMNWAEATLGTQFSIQVTLQEDHRLVTSGPYRLLRHPRYVSILLYNLGLALLFRSWLALLLVGLLAGVLLWRIQAEETLMRQGFGAEWESYSRRTRRLIPWIY